MMAGLPANEENDMEFRVVASVSEYVSSLISEAVPAKVTLFADSFPSIYMIGAAVGGWGTDLAVEIVSTGEPSVYTTIAYFDVANGTNFRFFNNPDWGASIGGYDVFTNYPEDLLSPATSDSDPNFNFIGEPGWYELVVNTEEGTIAMEAVSEPVMYLTGDATHGWSWDDPVTQLQWVSYNIWEGEVNFTQGGAFRLFPQKDWGPTSYGYDVITNYDTNILISWKGMATPTGNS
jgi:starch-binding outer membrane protein SusE/F